MYDRRAVETVWIHKGTEPFGGGNINPLVHMPCIAVGRLHGSRLAPYNRRVQIPTKGMHGRGTCMWKKSSRNRHPRPALRSRAFATLLVLLVPAATCSDVTEPAPGPLTLLTWRSAGTWPHGLWLGEVGTPVPDSIQVEVNDTTHARVPGVVLEWAVVSGGGTVEPRTSITDALGVARAQWTLGDEVGEQRLRVSAPTGDSAWFDAVATPPNPDDWTTVMDVDLVLDPAEIAGTPPDTLTATLTVTNQWTGMMRVRTYDSCLAITRIHDTAGAGVDHFPSGCYAAIWYRFMEPQESIESEWTLVDLALEPGEYTVRAHLHVTGINGDVLELDNPEATLVIR